MPSRATAVAKGHFKVVSSGPGATSPVGQVSTGPLFSPDALINSRADLGDYDVRGSIDERSTELAA